MTAPKQWKWTPKKYQLAKYLSEGDTYAEAGNKCEIAEKTVNTYMYMVPEFRLYVDKITLENEKASRTGILRGLFKIADQKQNDARADKSTYLDYLKFIKECTDDNEAPDTELTVTFK